MSVYIYHNPLNYIVKIVEFYYMYILSQQQNDLKFQGIYKNGNFYIHQDCKILI